MSNRCWRRNYSTLLIPFVVASFLIAFLVVLLAPPPHAYATEKHSPPDAPGSISGTVMDESGAPLENMTVSIFRKSQRWVPQRSVPTDGDGNYRIPVLGAGTYRLFFSDPARRFAPEYYSDVQQIEEGQDIIILGNDVTGIDAKLSVGGSITGTFTIPPNRVLGYANLTVAMLQDDETWRNIDTSTSLTQTGSYRLGGLLEGTYRLCISGNTYDLNTQNGTPFSICYDDQEEIVEATTIHVVQGMATANINFAVGGVAEVRGLVTSADGTALSNISISVLADEEGEWSTINYFGTGPTGQYTITGLAPGTYTLAFQDFEQAYAPHFLGGSINISQALTVRVQEQEIYTAAVEVLSSGAKISGNVRVAGEALLNSGDVSVSRATQNPWLETNTLRGAISPQTGDYVVGGLLPGTYRLFAFGRLDTNTYSGFYDGPVPTDVISVTVAVGELITGIYVSLGQGVFESEISGIVSAEDKPLPNIRVELDEQADGQHIPVVHTTTDAQGHYRLPGLGAGSYCLHFIDPTGFYARAKSSPHEIGFRCKRIDLMPQTVLTDVNKSLVRGGSISGNVHTFDGTPVTGATVSVFTSVLGKWDKTVFRSTTDDTGNYAILGMMPRPYRLLVTGPSGASTEEYYGTEGDIDQATDVYVVGGEAITNIDIILGPDIDPNGPKLYLPLVASE